MRSLLFFLILTICSLPAIAATFTTESFEKAADLNISLSYPDSYKIKEGDKTYDIVKFQDTNSPYSMCYLEIMPTQVDLSSVDWSLFFNDLASGVKNISDYPILRGEGVDKIISYKTTDYPHRPGLMVSGKGEVYHAEKNGYVHFLYQMFGYKQYLFGVRCLSVGFTQKEADERFNQKYVEFLGFGSSIVLNDFLKDPLENLFDSYENAAANKNEPSKKTPQTSKQLKIDPKDFDILRRNLDDNDTKWKKLRAGFHSGVTDIFLPERYVFVKYVHKFLYHDSHSLKLIEENEFSSAKHIIDSEYEELPFVSQDTKKSTPYIIGKNIPILLVDSIKVALVWYIGGGPIGAFTTGVVLLVGNQYQETTINNVYSYIQATNDQNLEYYSGYKFSILGVPHDIAYLLFLVSNSVLWWFLIPFAIHKLIKKNK